MRKKSFWLFLLLALIIWTLWQVPPHKQSEIIVNQTAIEKAKQELPTTGVLEQNHDGFVFLKLPDEYVMKLFPLVEEPGFEIPYSIKRHSKTGAHISVFYPNESSSLGPISEMGKTFSFEPKNIRHVRAGRKKYIILEVEAPELEQLRQKYGLQPKLLGHEFHVTLAEKHL